MSKCPFCEIPCNNEHCAYKEDKEQDKSDDCDKKLKGLIEENKRLLQLIKEMSNNMRKRN